MSNVFKESGRQMRRFYKEINQVFTSYETLEECDGGYRMTYPDTRRWRRLLEAFRASFAERFQAFDVRLGPAPVSPEGGAGRMQLELAGGEGGREFLEGLIASAQAGALVIPSIWKEGLVHAARRSTSALRRDPDFLILGAPRCGTTALHSYLSEHPRVLSGRAKELGYFDIFHGRGRGWYRSMFPLRSASSSDGSGHPAITGEATPTYLAHPAVPGRVRADLPDAKLIVMVRSPTERAYSQYHWGVRNGFEELSFEDAIDREEQRLQGETERMLHDPKHVSVEWIYHSYASTGRYAEHIERWFAEFPREQLLILCLEDFNADPSREFARVLEFLELPSFEPAQFAKVNAFPYPDLDARVRERLRATFAPQDERLRELLGRDLGWDRHRPPGES